jgi:hypothetical protein
MGACHVRLTFTYTISFSYKPLYYTQLTRRSPRQFICVSTLWVWLYVHVRFCSHRRATSPKNNPTSKLLLTRETSKGLEDYINQVVRTSFSKAAWRNKIVRHGAVKLQPSPKTWRKKATRSLGFFDFDLRPAALENMPLGVMLTMNPRLRSKNIIKRRQRSTEENSFPAWSGSLCRG